MSNIQVFARFRPKFKKEKRLPIIYEPFDGFDSEIMKTIVVDEGVHGRKKYSFDRIFEGDTKQKEIYDVIAAPFVLSVLKGFNSTIIAYGQTASGKTYTMSGTDKRPGIIPRIVDQIFEFTTGLPALHFDIKASYIEIYKESINDLMDVRNTNLLLREIISKDKRGKNYVYVQNATVAKVRDKKSIHQILKMGAEARKCSSTHMNDKSSRSHAVLILNIVQKNLFTKTKKSSTLYLVDLAGSELVNESKVVGNALKEAQYINKSLSSLSRVIRALTDKHMTHIPYRDSRLTQLLRDSLGGNSKTSIILNCAPCNNYLRETVATLMFGMRSQRVTNKPIVNKEITMDNYRFMVRKLKKKVKRLNTLLVKHNVPLTNSLRQEINLDRLRKSIIVTDSPMTTLTSAIEDETQYHRRLSSTELVGNDISNIATTIDLARASPPAPPSVLPIPSHTEIITETNQESVSDDDVPALLQFKHGRMVSEKQTDTQTELDEDELLRKDLEEFIVFASDNVILFDNIFTIEEVQ